MNKEFDSFEDMDKFALEMRLMKTQKAVLEKQVDISEKQKTFSKILSLATLILAISTTLQVFFYFLVNKSEMNISSLTAIIIAACLFFLIVFIVSLLGEAWRR